MAQRFSLILWVIFLLSGCAAENTVTMKTLFVGTYTDGTSEGIYTLQFNPENGTLDSLQLKAILPNPSFLAISNDKNRLYAVQETADYDSLGGGVTAFSIKEEILSVLNSKGTGGAHPCHVVLSHEGQLAVSNYTGGNLAIFNLGEDGSLGERQLIDHKVLDTAKTPHVHKAHFNADGLFAADLGLDAVKRYSKIEGSWQTADQASLDLPDGAGPRHFEFNTDRSFLYVINELNSTITVFKRVDNGGYEMLETQNTLAAEYDGDSFCADIHLSQDGKFLYGTNRGENTVVIFSVDPQTGRLGLVGRESVRGDWPRNFTLDPLGKFLLVANQRSNNITVFSRNAEDGSLKYTGQFEMEAPVCLVFE